MKAEYAVVVFDPFVHFSVFDIPHNVIDRLQAKVRFGDAMDPVTWQKRAGIVRNFGPRSVIINRPTV